MSKINSYQDYQGLLSVGYIYLVILGILQESLYYSQLGINIIKYSSITDVLISPIAEITGSITSICIFIAVLFFFFKLPKWLVKMKDTEGWKTYFRISKDKELTNDGAQKILQQFSFVLLLFLLFGFFVGTGTGRGVGISGKIKDKALTFEDKLTFADNKTQNVCLLGKNSTYLFYMENDSSDIKITPISGGVLKSFSEAK